jgi:hypothetical protein
MYQEKADEDKYGDIRDTSVTYMYYYRKMYGWLGATEQGWTLHDTVTVTGKLSSAFLKQTTMMFTNVPDVGEEGFLGWEVKVVRTTPDTLSTTVRNTTYVDSLAEVYGDVYSYPHCALIQQVFSSEFFQRIPNREFDVRGLKVKVPADYNTILKTYNNPYNGTANPYWRGNFKDEKEWTDNPVWCFYDLLTNKRYGLGKYLDEEVLDKWTLYDISQYCDTLVPDGYGGLEPRFTCNMVIQGRDDAHRIVNDLASVFRSLTYYAGNTIFCAQDKGGKQPIVAFTNANIENGDFSYSTSSKKARHTVCIVKYKDAREGFKQKVEYVEDIDGIRKFGIRQLEIAGVGCSSRGQAQRFGRWALFSEQMDTRTINFACGLEAVALRPGDIISVSDSNVSVKRYGGRTLNIINDQFVTLDTGTSVRRTITDTYTFTLMSPTFQYDTTIVRQDDGTPAGFAGLNTTDIPNLRRPQLQSIDFDGSNVVEVTDSQGITRTKINLPSRLDSTNYNIQGQHGVGDGLVWMIEPTGNTQALTSEADKRYEKYRILNIEEKDSSKFVISALEYNEIKFNRVDGIEGFDDTPIVGGTTPPISSQLDLNWITANSVEITWNIVPGDLTNVFTYHTYVKYGSPWAATDFVETDPNTTVPLDSAPDSRYFYMTTSVDDNTGSYFPTKNGNYYFRFYSANRLGITSPTHTVGFWNDPSNGQRDYVIIEGINPMHDVKIHSLTVTSVDTSDESDEERAAGTTFTRVHDKSEPTFRWKISVAGTSPSTAFDYRITIREPSGNNIPHGTILHTIPLINLSAGNTTFKYLAADSVRQALEQGLQPWRNYDIVVVALDAQTGETSSELPPDVVTPVNPEGYDILNSHNPGIGYVPLTPEDDVDTCMDPQPCEDDDPPCDPIPWCSDQWLTDDGDVKIIWSRTPGDMDIAARCGVLYISENDFTTIRDAGQLRGATDAFLEENGINKVVFSNESASAKGVAVTMLNYRPSEAYICVGLGDEFDFGLYMASLDPDSGYPLPGEAGYQDPLADCITNVSNVVKITPRNDIASAIGSGIWRAFLCGDYTGWNTGETSNPTGIDVQNIYNLTGAPSLTVYRPSGFFSDHHGNHWGHPLNHVRGGHCHPNEETTWDGFSDDCDNYGTSAQSCLRLAYSFGRFTSSHGAWLYEYLLLWQYTFTEPMPNNQYTVVFSPHQIASQSQPIMGSINRYAWPVLAKTTQSSVAGLSAVGEVDRVRPFVFVNNTWSHCHSCSAVGTRDYGHNVQSIQQHVFKAPEGFIVKQQVSDVDKEAFRDRPIFVGILHG